MSCLRATTDRGNYYGRQEREKRLSGCVVYENGLPPVFNRGTIIDTKKVYPVSHKLIARDFTAEPRRLVGPMPDEQFHERLFQAIRASHVIGNTQKLQLLGFIGVGF